MRLVVRARSAVYDALIVHMTAGWYRAVLQRLPVGCRLLDVGIGTGAALIANARLLVEKDVHVVGVDVDAAYLERCRRALVEHDLEGRVAVRLESIDVHQGGPYDAIYFSGSFMLLPYPAETLRRVRSLVRPDGLAYFTQTFEHRRSRAVEFLKPLLRPLTGIDFGRVSYEADFRGTLAAARYQLVEMETLKAGSRRSAVLAAARPIEASRDDVHGVDSA